MKKVVALIFMLLICLLSFSITYAENTLVDGVETSSDPLRYSFAWSSERYEQSAALPEKAELHLTLCRNEWESFQLLVKSVVPDQAVSVKITPFSNENGHSFEATVYQVGYEADNNGGFYPRTLTLADGTPVSLTEGLTTSFLMEIECPMDAPLGDYTATVTLCDANGTVLLEQAVTATVYRFRMPKSTMAYVEPSAGKKGKLPDVTGAEKKSFLGYMGNSYDYFRLALEVFGEEWLNEHFNNVVSDLADYMDDADFFASMRPKLAKALSGDMSDYREESAALQFKADGSFRIMVLTDIHQTCNDNFFDDVHAEYFRLAIEQTDPDLIVLLGDNVNTEDRGFPKVDDYIRSMMEYFEEWGVPVTTVFGNHESDNSPLSMPRALQLSVYQTFDCFIGKVGPDLPGAANHTLPILSSDGSKIAFNLWFFDSGSYHSDPEVSKYSCIEPEQIAWYVEESNALKAANGGQSVPSIVFQHIIVPEIFDVLVKDESSEIGWALPEGSTGVLGELPCPPDYSNGQFAAFVAQGDVLATVHGHDHINSFIVENQGIDIIMTPTCSTFNYSDETRGIRIIELNEGNLWNYETWIIQPSDVNSPW